ncbi:MAG: hypothetical protein KBG30_09075 [Bacteroidales bacterium]|nr:hypothetical protein [Bacteroidales bacterium]
MAYVKRILISEAYKVMLHNEITGADIMFYSEIIEKPLGNVGLNRVTLNNLKHGVKIAESTKEKFLRALNFALKKQGSNRQYIKHELWKK